MLKPGERRLAYSDRSTQYLTSTIVSSTEGDTLENEQALTFDVPQFLALEVTGEQYTQLFSCVIFAADLLYNESAHEILWPLWKAGKMESWCNALADGIDQCDDVQAALMAWALANGLTGGVGDPEKPLPEGVLDEPWLPDDFTCDNDHLWAMALTLVEGINSAVTEVFQAIEVATNELELASETADNVPIFQLAATISDFILWVQESAWDAYSLAWSDVTRDAIACELFCSMQVGELCSLNYNAIWDIYLDTDFTDPPSITDPLIDWAVWVMALPLTDPTDTVKICSLMGLLAMRYGGKFGSFTLGVRTVKLLVALAADKTDDEWEILCDECPDVPWLAHIDFTVDDGGYELDDIPVGEDWGVYVPSTGWGTTLIYEPGSAKWMTGCAIQLDFTGGTYSLLQSTMYFDYVLGDWDATAQLAQRITREATHTNVNQGSTSDGDDQELATNMTEIPNATKHRLFTRSSNDPSEVHDYGMALITSVDIRGTGDIPPELEGYIV